MALTNWCHTKGDEDPVGKETYVEVTGPAAVVELVDRVREIMGLPAGEMRSGDQWVAGAVVVEPLRWPDESNYDYEVRIYTGQHADGDGRRLFRRLSASTTWALRLIDDGFATVAQRPAVREAS